MATTTRTQIPAEVNNFYDSLLLVRALPLNIHGLFGQQRNIARKAGTGVIKFRRYGTLTAATTPLTEGATPSGSQLSVTDITATVSQYGDFVTVSDVVDDQSIDPMLTEMSELFGEQMGLTNDQLTRDVLAAGTNILYGGDAVSRVTVDSTDKIDATVIKKAVRQLKNNNARKLTRISAVNPGVGSQPVSACFVGIASPAAEYDIRVLTNFVPVEKYASNVVLLPGEFGTIEEVRFVQTTNAKVFAGAGASGIDVHATLIMGADAYGVVDLGNSQSQGLIFHGLGSAGSADPLNQRQTAGWKEYFTTKILNDNFMVRVEHAVSA